MNRSHDLLRGAFQLQVTILPSLVAIDIVEV